MGHREEGLRSERSELHTRCVSFDELLAKLQQVTEERDAYRKNYELALVELEKLRRGLQSTNERERVSPEQLRLALETLAKTVPSLSPLLAAAADEESDPRADRGERGDRGKRPGHGRRPIPESLPIVEIRVELPVGERVGMDEIGQETSDTVEWRRGGYVRVRVVRPKYADLANAERGVACAEAPRRPYPRALFGPALMARILFGKYGEHMPLAGLERSFAREDYEIPRSRMCGVVEGVCENGLARIVAAMIEDSKAAHAIATDATGILVQAKDKCRRGHVFVAIADRDHVVFHFAK